jgi:hypothetical protein
MQGPPSRRTPRVRRKTDGRYHSRRGGERYCERMTGVSERVVGHVESMDLDEILSRSSQVEKIDTVARRTFGLDDAAPQSGAIQLDVLCSGRAIVQVNQKNG